MSRLQLVYLKIEKKEFNKWETLNKFINTKVYKALSVRKNKKGVWYELQFKEVKP